MLEEEETIINKTGILKIENIRVFLNYQYKENKTPIRINASFSTPEGLSGNFEYIIPTNQDENPIQPNSLQYQISGLTTENITILVSSIRAEFEIIKNSFNPQ